MDTRVDLDVIGAVENANKSSCVGHAMDYLRHYEAMLEEFRESAINVIEIGVAAGASLRIWKWFFSRAQIIGIDINPNCARHAQERIKIEIGSQTDGALLARVARQNPPTVVVDDGSHVAEHMIYSFEKLFPRLLPGGIYIVEDVAGFVGVHAADEESASKPNAPEYFLDLARHCFAKAPTRSRQKVPWPIAATVDSVYFLGAAVIIRKKHAERDVARALATAESYMQGRTMRPSARENLAAYAIRHRGATEFADQTLQTLVREHGSTMSRLLLRAENFHNAGRIEEARSAVREAASCPPENHFVMTRMARLQAAVGDIQAALISAEAALSERPGFPPFQRQVAALRAKLAQHA